MTDFIAELDALSLSLRLRRLSDRLLEDGRQVYTALGLPLEPSWYAPLMLLAEHEPLAVTELAGRLRLKHPTVITLARKLENAGLVVASADPGDARRRLLSLSTSARARLPELERVWAAFRGALEELVAEGAPGIVAELDALEALLTRHGLDARVLARHAASESAPRAPLVTSLAVRPTEARDREGILPLARALVDDANTYAFDPDVSDDALWAYWAPAAPGRGYVAEEGGALVGVVVIKPNHPGPGAHVANASYAVRADARGRGIGRSLGEASLEIAKELGYAAMQFNIVVGTNTAALRLWRALGFRVVGTIPDGFELPSGERVEHHILFRRLD